MPVEAVDLFAKLLSDAEAGPTDAFYSRLAAATCLLADMRRAVIFAYDGERRIVRAVGAHGVDLDLFAGASPTADQVAVAARALKAGRRSSRSSEVERELPEEYHPLLDGGLVVCIPMSAGGRGIGVIVADRLARARPADRRATPHPVVARQDRGPGRRRPPRHPRARARAPPRRADRPRARPARGRRPAAVRRLARARGGGDLERRAPRARPRGDPARARRAARRAAARRWRPPAARPRATCATSSAACAARTAAIDVALVDGRDVAVPDPLQPVAQSVLREAVRNAVKHAEPTLHRGPPRRRRRRLRARDRQRRRPRRRPPTPAGIGLRLAAFEALESGGIVDFGPLGDDRWRVRLTVPQ